MRSGSSVRTVLSVVVAATLTLGAPATAVAQQPEASDPDMTEARAAYEKGERAYRLGRMEEAAAEFERAYELSGLPGFLYNIGLAHLRWYDIDPDVAHLRQAKVVFENYQLELQKDPELGDPEEAKNLLAEIDRKISEHSDAKADPEPEPEPEPTTEVSKTDPGKPMRLAGAVTMGVGGALVLGGVVAGVVMAVRSKEFDEELDKTYALQAVTDCSAPANAETCQALDDRADLARTNGRRANLLGVGLGVGLGGAGLIALVAGALVFVRGTKKTSEWERRRLGIAPTWMRGGGGLAFHGRF